MKEPDIPKLKAIRDGQGRAKITCPYCGRSHTHSWRPGWRVSHCRSTRMNDGYIIELTS
jgi:ribosome modulation factor